MLSPKRSNPDDSQKECPELSELFVAHLEGASRLTEQNLNEHLQSCPRCLNQFDFNELLDTWSRLGQLPEVRLSPAYFTKLRQKLVQVETERQDRRQFWRGFNLLFEWSKLPALAAVMYLIFTSQIHPLPSGSKGPDETMVNASVQQILQRGVPELVADLGFIYRQYLKQRSQG